MTFEASDAASLYPLRFEPVLQAYAWGGRKLATSLGRELPPGIIAESWEIAAHADGETRIANGALAGRTLVDAAAEMGPALLGRQRAASLADGRFPLLIKILDAAEWLSVQVHPDDAWAGEHEGDRGKTEMWVVLEAEEGAELIQGFRPGVDREGFAEAVRSGDAEDFLHRVPVRAGDVFFLPPGTIHALGPGILLAEIQQSSNVTYRVFDWNRDHPDRPLHLEESMDVLDFGIVSPGAVVVPAAEADGVKTERLVSCSYFETSRLGLAPGAVWKGDCDGETFEAWCILDGRATLRWSGGSETLKPVEWLLLPAALGEFEIAADQASTLLRVVAPADSS